LISACALIVFATEPHVSPERLLTWPNQKNEAVVVVLWGLHKQLAWLELGICCIPFLSFLSAALFFFGGGGVERRPSVLLCICFFSPSVLCLLAGVMFLLDWALLVWDALEGSYLYSHPNNEPYVVGLP